MTFDNKSDSDLLISRVVDGEATDADWNAFRAMAEREPSLWRELAECQRDHAELSGEVVLALRASDRVDAPVQEEMGRRFSERVRIAATWTGWAAAAVVAVMFYTGRMSGGNQTPTNQSGLVNWKDEPQKAIDQLVDEGRITPQELYQTYLSRGLERGSVLGEVPELRMVELRPMKAGGGYEVIFLRQIMERTHVKELNKRGFDEFGREVPIPFQPNAQGGSARY